MVVVLNRSGYIVLGVVHLLMEFPTRDTVVRDWGFTEDTGWALRMLINRHAGGLFESNQNAMWD